MDYTLESLIEILRTRLQDQDFDENTLIMFLNLAQDEILGEDKHTFMQRIDEYEAEPEGEISLPFAYSATFQIFANKPNQPRRMLEFISPDEFFDNTKSRTMVWTKFANQIFYRLYKSDQQDGCPFDCDGFKITHLYLINPKPLKEKTDKSPIPAQYIEALILGAMARAEQYRDNFDYAAIYQNQEDQILTNMKLRYGPGNLTASNRAKLPFGGTLYDHI